MRKELKSRIIESLSAQIKENPNFYLADISGLNAGDTTRLRRECFGQGIRLVVVKNTLLRIVIRQMENPEMEQLVSVLDGNTAILFTTVANAPARLIQKMLKSGMQKPELKGAYVQECAFVGADKLEVLAAIKSREELIGDLVALLQSPARRVLSALQSAGEKIAGLVKTLSEKEEK